MGNGKRTPRKPWVVFGRALALSLGIYLAGHLLLAALLVRGTVGEGAAFAVTAGLCVIASAAGAFWAAGQAGMGRLPGAMVGRGALCVRSDRGRCSGLAGDYLDGTRRHPAVMCPGRRPSGRPAGRAKTGRQAAAPLTEDYGENSQKGLRRWLTLPRNAAGGGPSENPQMWGFIAKTTQDPVLFDAISRNGGIFVSTVYIIMFT